MESFIPKQIETYAENCTTVESPLLKALARETYKKMDYPQMLIGRTEGQFLKLLIRISGARKVLEIGTFTGYSALVMAEDFPTMDNSLHVRSRKRALRSLCGISGKALTAIK